MRRNKSEARVLVARSRGRDIISSDNEPLETALLPTENTGVRSIKLVSVAFCRRRTRKRGDDTSYFIYLFFNFVPLRDVVVAVFWVNYAPGSQSSFGLPGEGGGCVFGRFWNCVLAIIGNGRTTNVPNETRVNPPVRRHRARRPPRQNVIRIKTREV